MNPWPRNPALRAWCALWSSPTAAVGIAIALLVHLLGCTWKPSLRDGVLVLQAKGWLGWAMRRAGWGAFTLAWLVFAWQEPTTQLLCHESQHTVQAFSLGPFFLPAWLSFAVGMGYRLNPLEVAARLGSGEPPYGR